MKFGYCSANNAQGISPAVLARELEQRGFESLWVPEHSHMPLNCVAEYPDPRMEMPDGYAHMMNPFVSLMAAAASTTRLKLATGICLVLEHDLLDLACTTATLDVLSEGRLILGAGVGWATEELSNHRPELQFRKRYSAFRERIAALRAAWGQQNQPYQGRFHDKAWSKQISSYQGKYDSFSESWVFPKPKTGTIPIALGLVGPLGVQHAANYADLWCPVDQAMVHAGKLDVGARIASFRDLLQQAGRDPGRVPITVFVWSNESPETLENYASHGVDRIVFPPCSFTMHPKAETLKRLDKLQHTIELFPESGN